MNYLKNGNALDEGFRAFLIGLLSHKGYRGHRLAFERTNGRPNTPVDTFKRNLAAYDYVNELQETPITYKSCQKIGRAVSADAVVVNQNRKAASSKVRKDRTYFDMTVGGRSLKFEKNKTMTRQNAYALAARKFGLSPSALRKIVEAIDKAKAAG